MSAGDDPLERSTGTPATVKKAGTGTSWLSWIVLAAGRATLFGSAAIGAVVLVLALFTLLNIDAVSRLAADHVLANAIRPSGREMPATSGTIPYAAGDIQIIGGMGQGLSCSLPPLLEKYAFPTDGNKSPVGLKMRQACAYHDYCYRHGAATYGYTQADCDFALQTQAFRLCKFIEKENDSDTDKGTDSDCIRDARLVTLGVLLGGSDSFRSMNDREDASTFFEFDPYPTQSQQHTVYRVADAPAEKTGRRMKAMYRFRIRPSGIIIDYAVIEEPFRPFTNLSGSPQFLTVAPLVVRTGVGAAAVDWFVWWQRVSEDETTGRLLALAPGLATPDELKCLVKLDDCLDAAPQ
ncbi:hypothetical protein ACO2RV_24330 [Ancylobacter sp. VNQ12]|uniref:hypothetical protein n=1 Tax=Ancylobacter sp. VNQ12 TaxID=3400920 RepID=UPI003BFFE319